MSKQPQFKAGAVRIEKIPEGKAKDGPFIREQQSAAVKKAEEKNDASKTTTGIDDSKLERQMELWLGETYEGTVQLLEIYKELIPELIHHDQEVEGGLHVLSRLAESMRVQLEPHVLRLGENKQRGLHRAHVLRQALFPSAEDVSTSPSIAYEVLETLQGLHVYLAHINSSLTALEPVAQAMWDEGFSTAVAGAQRSLHRQVAWVKQQIQTRSSQTLLVPVVPKSSSN